MPFGMGCDIHIHHHLMGSYMVNQPNKKYTHIFYKINHKYKCHENQEIRILTFLMDCGSTKSFCDFITFLNVSFVFKFYRLLYLEESYLFTVYFIY